MRIQRLEVARNIEMGHLGHQKKNKQIELHMACCFFWIPSTFDRVFAH